MLGFDTLAKRQDCAESGDGFGHIHSGGGEATPVLYIKHCEECGYEFDTLDPRVRLCRGCYLKEDKDFMEVGE